MRARLLKIPVLQSGFDGDFQPVLVPDGTVAPVESLRSPYTAANLYLTTSNLWVRPGTNEVTMLYVETDGVHVYRRLP
jgi:hypothetical protein